METTKIVFLLLPKMHLQDLAGPAQVFYEASELGSRNFKIVFAAADKNITSAQGLALAELADVQDLSLKKGDLVCVPGFDFASFQAGELDG